MVRARSARREVGSSRSQRFALQRPQQRPGCITRIEADAGHIFLDTFADGQVRRSLDRNRRMPTAEVALRIIILDADTAIDTLIHDLLFASISLRNG
jgi:hypothetical protein